MTALGTPVRSTVSYAQAHLRLKLWRGRPDTMRCVRCGEKAANWAYLGGDPVELFSVEGYPYSLDMDRYAPMCVSCHHRSDRARADGRPESVCPRGHEWNECNTGIRKRGRLAGQRFCLACHRENTAAWRRARAEKAAQTSARPGPSPVPAERRTKSA